MLLAEFVGRSDVDLDDDRRKAVDLHQVRAFVFGKFYEIQLINGKTYDVRDLEVILSVIHDEFELWKHQWVPDVQIQSLGNFNSKNRQLVVKAEVKGSFLPVTIPTKTTIDRIRQAVTMYNLTGSWDQFNKGNL